MTQYTHARIEGLHASWGSGIASLITSKGAIHCDNGETIRGLRDLFPDVIGEGHTVNVSALKGQEIVYCLDEIGLLDGFTSYQNWLAQGLPDIEINETCELSGDCE